jgi:hypothetical protein
MDDAPTDQTFSAGEAGSAVDEAGRTTDGRRLIDVVVGEIPDPERLAHMLWTARCEDAAHDLLGTFDHRAEAEECRQQHLLHAHGDVVS